MILLKLLDRPFDIDDFSKSLLLDEYRDTLRSMTKEQLKIVRMAYRFGQANERANNLK